MTKIFIEETRDFYNWLDSKNLTGNNVPNPLVHKNWKMSL